MKKEPSFLESIQIPDIPMEDIIETIELSKQIVKEAAPQKLEMKKSRQLLTILRFHFPKLLCLEFMLCIIAAMMLMFSSFINIQDAASSGQGFESIPLLCFCTILIGSLLLSITTSVELTRSRISDTWEIEKACMIRLELIILFKMFLMSFFAFLGLGILSLMLSQVQQEVSALTIFVIGMIPYLIITTCLIQGSHLIHSVQEMAALYAVFTAGYAGLLFLLSKQIALVPTSSMLGILTISIVACFSFNSYTLIKQS